MGAVALSSCPLQQKPDEPSSFKHFPDRDGLEINFSNKSMGVSLLSRVDGEVLPISQMHRGRTELDEDGALQSAQAQPWGWLLWPAAVTCPSGCSHLLVPTQLAALMFSGSCPIPSSLEHRQLFHSVNLKSLKVSFLWFVQCPGHPYLAQGHSDSSPG